MKSEDKVPVPPSTPVELLAEAAQTGEPDVAWTLAVWLAEARTKQAQVQDAWSAWRRALAESDEATKRAAGFLRRGRRHQLEYQLACRDEVDADNRAIETFKRLDSFLKEP